MRKAHHFSGIVILLFIQHLAIAQQYSGFDLMNTDAYSLRNRTALLSGLCFIQQKATAETRFECSNYRTHCKAIASLSTTAVSKGQWKFPEITGLSHLTGSVCVRAPDLQLHKSLYKHYKNKCTV